VRDAVPFNKTAFCCQSLRQSGDAGGHPLAGRGGERRRRAAASRYSTSSWWGDLWIPQLEAFFLPPADRGGEGSRGIFL
jgi:hypothetical protein